jgi:hypothetical protein
MKDRTVMVNVKQKWKISGNLENINAHLQHDHVDPDPNIIT